MGGKTCRQECKKCRQGRKTKNAAKSAINAMKSTINGPMKLEDEAMVGPLKTIAPWDFSREVLGEKSVQSTQRKEMASRGSQTNEIILPRGGGQ